MTKEKNEKKIEIFICVLTQLEEMEKWRSEIVKFQDQNTVKKDGRKTKLKELSHRFSFT